jgi:excisionase family DNA binding protein
MSGDAADDEPQRLTTIGLEEAAAVLRMAPGTLRKRTAAGKVPGYKPGRQWVFLPHEIMAYLQASAPACRAIDVKTLRTGGVVSRSINGRSVSPLERELEAKLRSLKPRLARPNRSGGSRS